MTALSDHIATINGWLNFQYSDELVTSWTRMCEEAVSRDLRVKHMIQIDTATINANRVLLPTDWLKIEALRVIDGAVLKYRTYEEFYREVPDDDNYNSGYYTIVGNYIILDGNQSDGDDVELVYFQNVPALADEANWLMTYYPTLYIMGTLAAACLYGIEDERASTFAGQFDTVVDRLNVDYKASKFPGTVPVKKRTRGFG